MAFLNNVDQVRNIEWGRSFLWDIKFEGDLGGPAPPAPFSDWFPAVDVSEPTAELVTHSIDLAGSAIKVPHRSTPFDISVTFLDDHKHTLRHWLEEWINVTCLKNGRQVEVLKKCCRIMHIAKLTPQRVVFETSSYYVFPEGQVKFDGNSGSDIIQHQLSFCIAGDARTNAGKSQSTQLSFQDTGTAVADGELVLFG